MDSRFSSLPIGALLVYASSSSAPSAPGTRLSSRCSRADSDLRGRGPHLVPASRRALRGASRADEFPAVGALPPIGCRSTRRRTGRARKDQRGCRPKSSPADRVARRFPRPSACRIRTSLRESSGSRANPGNDFLVGVVDWKRDAAGKWHSVQQRRASRPFRPADFHV